MSFKGKRHSSKARSAISKALKGKHYSKEQRRELSRVMKGKQNSLGSKRTPAQTYNLVKGQLGDFCPLSMHVLCNLLMRADWSRSEVYEIFGIAPNTYRKYQKFETFEKFWKCYLDKLSKEIIDVGKL